MRCLRDVSMGTDEKQVNSTSNRVTMWKEFLDSENGDPNLARQKTLQSLKSPTALKVRIDVLVDHRLTFVQRVWASEAVKLNEMFDNIDKFDMSEVLYVRNA